MLRDVATEWWDVLPDDTRTDWEQALAAFTERFVDLLSTFYLVKWQKAGALNYRRTGQRIRGEFTENCEMYGCRRRRA